MNAGAKKKRIQELKAILPGASESDIQRLAGLRIVPTWDKTKWIGLLQEKMNKLDFPHLTQANAPVPSGGQRLAYEIARLQEMSGRDWEWFKRQPGYQRINAMILEAVWQGKKEQIRFLQDFVRSLKLSEYAINSRDLYRWIMKRYAVIQELAGVEAVVEYLRKNFPGFDKSQIVHIRKILREIGFTKSGLPARLKVPSLD